MGDAFFAFGIIGLMLFLFNRKDLALQLLLTVIVSLVIVQLSKMLFSGGSARLYFEAGNPGSNSNDIVLSSHTAVAFTLAGFFALELKNNFALAGLFITATAVAYSRIWLGESMTTIVCGLFPAVTAVFFTKWFSSADRPVSLFKKRKISRTDTQQLFPA